MNRAGRKIQNMSGEAAYFSFLPAQLPPQPPIELDGEMTTLLVNAHKQLILLEQNAAHIPNINLLVSMYVRKEALMSSQIEGTQATLEDVFDPAIEKNSNRNVADVINYIKATDFALTWRETLPLSNRLIRETHAVLLDGVRGQEKNAGEFRRSQNWIGAAGSSIKTARYIPPMPEDMIISMSDLEKYINYDDNLDVLIQAALIHYQFETIHPFLDGNGRIGRLLITLFLMEKHILTTPALYISYFLKKNRVEYYDRMSEVRNSGNYEQWVKFFLRAIAESAADATATIGNLIALHKQNSMIIKGFGRSSITALRLLDYLEEKPIIEISPTAAALGLTFNAVAGAVKRLTEVDILTETTGNRRNRTFSYTKYIDILRNGT
jgi:Fic family protein